MQSNLTILTLNVWGIPLISAHRNDRIEAIGCMLASGDYDLVSLQEVWSQDNYKTLKEKVKDKLPYTHYFYSGVFGSGLCVFSKYPIVNAFFHAWPVNGYVHRITHGDWFGGKGVGMCKILYGDIVVHFYVAHLHAEYNHESDDYKAHRVVQAFDTAQFLENTRGSAAVQIIAGDLNTEPGDLAYRVLCYEANLEDAFDPDYGKSGTSECPYNSYTSLSEKLATNNDGKRIDHILYRGGFKYLVERLEYKHPLPNHVPGTEHSYSDHEAVVATLQITKKRSMVNPQTEYMVCSSATEEEEIEAFEYKSEKNVRTIQEAICVCDQSLVKIASSKTVYLTLGFIVLCMLFQFIEMKPMYGLHSVYLLFKVALSGLVMYFLFMGTLWNKLEKNGVLSGKLAMQISLYNKYKKCPE